MTDRKKTIASPGKESDRSQNSQLDSIPIRCSSDYPCRICGAADHPCYWSTDKLMCAKGGKIPDGFHEAGFTPSKQHLYLRIVEKAGGDSEPLRVIEGNPRVKRSSRKRKGVADEKTEKKQPLQQDFETVKAAFERRLRYNSFCNSVEVDGHKFDLGIAKLNLVVDYNLTLKTSKEDVADIISKVAKLDSYSPVAQYLRTCHEKFGSDTSILNGLAERYFGTANPIHQVMLRRWLISCVARAFQPGCKVDTALILQGEQGFYKSECFKTLAGADWFSDSLSRNIADKDARLGLYSVWIVEWAELETVFKRSDISMVKAFLSSATDCLRKPYGRSTEQLKRPSVIVGSTNLTEFLADPTGSRRFWIVPVVAAIDLKRLKAERDQIWAAAVALYEKGEQWWLTREEEAAATQSKQAYQSRDPWHDAITSYLEDREMVSTGEILTNVLKLDIDRHGQGDKNRVAGVLQMEGWEPAPSTRWHQSKKQRVWVKKVAHPTVPTVPTAQNSDSENVASRNGDGTPPERLKQSDSNFVPASKLAQTFVEKEFSALGTVGTVGEGTFSNPGNLQVGDRVTYCGKNEAIARDFRPDPLPIQEVSGSQAYCLRADGQFTTRINLSELRRAE